MAEGKSPYKNLGIAAVALLTLAVVTLSGLMIVNQYGYVLRTSTDVNITGITLVTNNTVSLGTSYAYPSAVENCHNESNATDYLSTTYYTINEGATATAGGNIVLNQDGADAGWNGETVNCTDLTYRAASSASNAAVTFSTALAIFGTFSAVIALALVGKIIVNIFKRKD